MNRDNDNEKLTAAEQALVDRLRADVPRDGAGADPLADRIVRAVRHDTRPPVKPRGRIYRVAAMAAAAGLLIALGILIGRGTTPEQGPDRSPDIARARQQLDRSVGGMLSLRPDNLIGQADIAGESFVDEQVSQWRQAAATMTSAGLSLADLLPGSVGPRRPTTSGPAG
jgi:hypothetical protein